MNMIEFGKRIGIDPDDDRDATQRRLVFAWEHHCAQVARNERGLLLSEKVFSELAAENRETIAIFNFAKDVLSRLESEESKETLITGILLVGLEHVAGSLSWEVQQWIKERK